MERISLFLTDTDFERDFTDAKYKKVSQMQVITEDAHIPHMGIINAFLVFIPNLIIPSTVAIEENSSTMQLVVMKFTFCTPVKYPRITDETDISGKARASNLMGKTAEVFRKNLRAIKSAKENITIQAEMPQARASAVHFVITEPIRPLDVDSDISRVVASGIPDVATVTAKENTDRIK